MRKFSPKELVQILSSQLAKKIDQSLVEKWSASFWDILGRQEPRNLVDNVHQAGERSNLSQQHGEPFIMMLPPPNITGTLHLGHALTVAIQDALIRQRNMDGKQSLWIPGFDHAGIATQNIVERLLWNKHKLTRQEYGREKLVELAHQWKDSKRVEMKDQINRLGLRLNYEYEYFTLDDKSSLTVQEAFKQLFERKLIYRSVKPVFWSQTMQTTLSDIEVEKSPDGIYRYPRTGEIVERKELNQWFIDAKEMAERAVEVVQQNYIEMIPYNYRRSWSSWLWDNGVQDWCISRQNWWGHTIPAYKLKSADDNRENWVVANSLEEAREKLSPGNESDEVIQDPDVLDTWFSSSLLPLTISGWPDQREFQKRKELGSFPLSIMETGFDILTYWVSKMVMMSLTLTNEIPFKLILLHGMICDSSGKKMSKSKGNVIDPMDLIDGASLKDLQDKSRTSNIQGIIEDSQLDYVLEQQAQLFPTGIPASGADGLRAYLLSHDFQEEVVKIQIQQIEKIRRLSNKIWNIFRFTLKLFEDMPKRIETIDWKLSQQEVNQMDSSDRELFEALALCVEGAHESFRTNYQLHICFNRLEYFWTHKLSVKYVTDNKHVLFDKNHQAHELKFKILLVSIVTATKLLHPYMPHQSEFLYQKLYTTLLGDKAKLSEQSLPLISLISQDFPKLADWEEFARPKADIYTSWIPLWR